MKDFLFYLAWVAVVFGIGLVVDKGSEAANGNIIENKLDQYDSFIVNGMTFSTDDVKEVDVNYQYEAGYRITFTMKNGNEVNTTSSQIIWKREEN